MIEAPEIDAVDRAVASWPFLDATERDRLRALTDRLVRRLRWEHVAGIDLTHDLQRTIAVRAARLWLNLDGDPYPGLSGVLLHPTTVVRRGPHPGPARGVVSDRPRHLLGETAMNGPVLLAVDAVWRGVRHPERGNDVTYHEFAHRLDFLDGVVDGTPPIRDRDLGRRWYDVCTATFRRLRLHGDPVLEPYAATNPGEFFAVATELFFTTPLVLRGEHPALYGVLREVYRQDPGARLRRLA